jgi:hypothetical protein
VCRDKAYAEVEQTSDLHSRAVTPWLLSTKWHLNVDGYDPEEQNGIGEAID